MKYSNGLWSYNYHNNKKQTKLLSNIIRRQSLVPSTNHMNGRRNYPKRGNIISTSSFSSSSFVSHKNIYQHTTYISLPSSSSSSSSSSFWDESYHYHWHRLFGTSRQKQILSTKTTTTTTTPIRMATFTNDHDNDHDDDHQSMQEEHSVVVIGSANYDMTVYTDTIPHMGETVLGGTFMTSCGGKGSNQAIACQSLSSSSSSFQKLTTTTTTTTNTNTIMICSLGHDIFGQQLYDNLRKHHVVVYPSYDYWNNDKDNYDESSHNNNSSSMKNDRYHHHDHHMTSSGVACITVDTNTGNNMIIVAPGTNQLLTPSMVRQQFVSIHPFPTILLVQLEIPYDTIYEVFQIVQEHNGRNHHITNHTKTMTLCNPAPAPSNVNQYQQFAKSYPYIDILIPNEIELRTLYLYSIGIYDHNTTTTTVPTEEEMAKHLLLKKKIRYAVIVTLGERGAVIIERKIPIKNNHDDDVDENNTNRNVNHDDHHDDDSSQIQVTYVTEPNDLPCKHEPIIDTIGAGDGFCGALASYLSKTNYDHDDTITKTMTTTTNHHYPTTLSYLCSLACGYASMSIRRRGASYPTYDEIPNCLRMGKSSSSSTMIRSNIQEKPQILFITGNQNKLKEVQQILSTTTTTTTSLSIDDDKFPYDIINENIDLPELQGDDTIEIAKEKCIMAAKQYMSTSKSKLSSSSSSSSSYPTILFTEDTSLCFHALHGMPGPYIKWFLKKCGHDGLYQMLGGYEDKTAYALTVVALIVIHDHDHDDSNYEVHIFEGRTEGRIVPPRGSLEFGWDPIFEPLHTNQTYAEMTKDEKNAISHRGRAFRHVREFLIKYYQQNHDSHSRPHINDSATKKARLE
jgi:inosine triphosphate pyrophosphatase